jgi:hypothetical protein
MAKRYALLSTTGSANAHSQTPTLKKADLFALFACSGSRMWSIPLKPWRWMHPEAKRLTTKYQASKMFAPLY